MKYDCQKGCVVLKQRRQCPVPVLGEEGHCLAAFDAGRTGFHRAHGWKKTIFVSPHSEVCPRAEKCMNIDKSTLGCGDKADRALLRIEFWFRAGRNFVFVDRRYRRSYCQGLSWRFRVELLEPTESQLTSKINSGRMILFTYDYLPQLAL